MDLGEHFKGIGFSSAHAAEKITVPILFVVAENAELGGNANVVRVHQTIKQRGVPTVYPVIKGITHYGVYAEAFAEATKLELGWFNEHRKSVTKPSDPKPESK